jgi:hypothetical protein
MRAMLAMSVLAACTYPEKIDRLECLGAPGPSSAAQLVTLTGLTLDPQTQMPFGGATLRLLNRELATLDGPVTSSSTGGFGFEPLNSAGVPVDHTNIYINGVADGRITTYVTPPRPLTENRALAFTMLSTAQYDLMATEAMGRPFTPGTGVVLVEIRDCDGEDALPGEAGIAGATLEASDGAVYYFVGIFPKPEATSTDFTGVVLVANVPPGTVELTATVGARRLPSRTVTIVPDALTQTIMMP